LDYKITNEGMVPEFEEEPIGIKLEEGK